MGTNRNLKDVIPFRATHPGFVIAEELDFMGVKRKDFAGKIGIQPSHLSELLNGKRQLTQSLALRIELHTELQADVLMRLQEQYNIDVKRIAQRDAANKKSQGTNTVSIRIPTETYELISSAAKKQGTTINTFIKNMLSKAVVML